jgi:hypothetical protein
VEVPDKLPGLPESHEKLLKGLGIDYISKIPDSLDTLVKREYKVTTSFKGGETEAFKIMKEYMKDKQKVLTF